MKVEAIKIVCPLCSKDGRRKWIDSVSPDARGPIFPLCKVHGNVRVDLDGVSGEKITIHISA